MVETTGVTPPKSKSEKVKSKKNAEAQEDREAGDEAAEVAAEGGADGAADPAADGQQEKSKKKKLPKWEPYQDLDFEPMSGFNKLPQLLLTLAARYPFFGDIVRAQLLAYEFRHDRTDKPASFCFAPAIGLMDAAVEKAEEAAEPSEVWFSGLVGDADLESLQEMASSKSEILFPGVLYGWNTKENAIANLATLGDNAEIAV